MQPPPDTKDWTYVATDGCAECGFSPDFDRDEIPARIRVAASGWASVLQRPGVRQRPAPVVWSPLEYACHVRDVFSLYDHRLHLMLTEGDPLYPNWDQDAAAVAGAYNEQDPVVVSRELASVGESIAAAFDRVAGQQWQRTGRRSDGKSFTVERFGRYFLHDVEHHLWDVRGS